MLDALSGKKDSGPDAVGASRSTGRMRKGKMKEAEMLEGLEKKARAQVKHLEDKTFYLQGNIWWDSTAKVEGRRTKIAYLSDEYFALLKKHPNIGPYLALGERVVFVLRRTTYEVAP